jgi:hypothetical protein
VSIKPPLEIPVFTIMKDVPIPPKRNVETAKIIELAKDMEVGDCIDTPYAKRGYAAIMERASGFKKKFTQRRVQKDGADLLRIWRIE